jgi:hypothetical protein
LKAIDLTACRVDIFSPVSQGLEILGQPLTKGQPHNAYRRSGSGNGISHETNHVG